MIAENIVKMPEFSCDEGFCVDSDKLVVMQTANFERLYERFWPVKSIIIEKISENKTKCVLGNYPNCEIFEIFNKNEGIPASSFIALCRKEKYENYVINKCEIGRVLITY